MKALFYFIIFILLGLLKVAEAKVISLPSDTSTILEKTNLEFTDASGTWSYGRGYNSLSGQKSGYCVLNKEPRTLIPNNNGQKVYFEMSKISSSSELIKKLSLEASANIKFGIGDIGGKASFANESKINSYSIYLLIKIEVRNVAQSFENDIDLKPQAYQLLEKYPEVFFKRCGDEFVESITTGAEFYALLEIETKSQEDQKSVNAALKGTFSVVFTADHQFSYNLLKILKDFSTKLRIYQAGGVNGDKFKTHRIDGTVIEEIRLPQDPDELIAYAAGFSSKVTVENSQPIFATTTRYDQLLNIPPEKSFYEVNTKQDVLNYLAKIADRLKGDLVNLEYIVQNSTQFIAVDLDYLSQTRTGLSVELNKVIEYASKCIRDFKCEYPTDLLNFSLNVPERKIGPQECETRKSKICGVQKYNTGRDLICGVEEYFSGEDASCGVELFVSARSERCNPEAYKTGSGAVCGVDHFNSKSDASICGMEEFRSCQDGPLGIGHRCHNRKRPKTCEHPTFGVASYKICSHPEFGISRYETCVHPGHGIEKYKSCPNAKFGIKTYKLCENQLFGVAEFNSCLLEKGKDQICSNPDME
jgi:hypothetical protein